MGSNHQPPAFEHDINDLRCLEDDPFVSVASRATPEYDFGEDNIDDAIRSYTENVSALDGGSPDCTMGNRDIEDATASWVPTTPQRLGDTHSGIRAGLGLPTPPYTEGNTPRAAYTSVFDSTQLSPLAFVSGSGLGSGLDVQDLSMAKLKRKAEDEDDIERLRRPRRKLYEPPATYLVDNPIAMCPPPLFTTVFLQLPLCAQYYLMQHGLHDVSFKSLVQWKDCKTNVVVMSQMRNSKAVKSKEDAGEAVDILYDKEQKARDVYGEIDKENAAPNPYGNIGFDEEGNPSDWFGGKVHLGGTVSFDETNGYQTKLERLTLGHSTQLTRRFGSTCLFRMKLPGASKGGNLGQKSLDYCKRPLVLWGSVYRAFYVKEDTVFFIKTNEVWDFSERRLTGERHKDGLSFLEFLQWYNPFGLNGDQAMSKWVSRLALMLSNSVPGFLPRKENIRFLDDIVNPVTGANMTDGAGIMNRALKRKLAHYHPSKQDACAVQVRVHGAKGLLVEDAHDVSEEPTLYITPSQTKIKYPSSDNDPAHLAIDLLRISHIRVGTQISAEILINLSENGVPLSAFISLLTTGFEELVNPFLEWCRYPTDEGHTLQRLWKHIATCRGVITARMARENPGGARAKGRDERDVRESAEADYDDGLGDAIDDNERALRWWPDPVSGQPASLPETIVSLLDAGFTPQSCPVLRDKLYKTVVDVVQREKNKIRIDVQLSATAFIEPDRSGFLKEDEISVRSSKYIFKRPDGTMTNVLVGDALVGRYPCKLPTDVRKFRAVDIPQLDYKRDTIVMSTQGPRRAADWLGGGDYDGDKAIVIWDPTLVEPFTNASDHYADPPEGVSKCFDQNVETVSEFLEKIEGRPEAEQISHMQDRCLASLRTRTDVGAYSTCHERAVYQLGYWHETTRRLGHMFCKVMDSSKSGLTVRKGVWEKDMRAFNCAPAWRGTSGPFDETNMVPLKRDPHLGPFIMDELLKEAKVQGDFQIARIERGFKVFQPNTEDTALSAPFREVMKKLTCPEVGSFYRRDLESIHKHVRSEFSSWYESTHVRAPHSSSGAPLSPHKNTGKGKGRESDSAFTNRDIESRQNALRDASRRFACAPDPKHMFMTYEAVNSVKASYAYLYDAYRKDFRTEEFSLNDMVKKVGRTSGTSMVSWSRFPWDVAFRDLSELKAKSLGDYKPVAKKFYERMSLKVPPS